jgi:NTP pyrophosphatase (non-canonical NTP hydrolase)
MTGEQTPGQRRGQASRKIYEELTDARSEIELQKIQIERLRAEGREGQVMNLNEYQQQAASTAIYPEQGQQWGGLIYCALKLNGEAGEVADKIGKAIRDEGGLISDERRDALILELGDVLWYVANMALELSASLDQVAERNLAKLAARKAHGVLRGDGDNR